MAGEDIARTRAAQVDDRGQLSLLSRRSVCFVVALQGVNYGAIQIRRGQLDGVTRNHPRVQIVEPTRVLDDDVSRGCNIFSLPQTCRR